MASEENDSDPLDVFDALRMQGERPDPGVFAARYPGHPTLLARIARLEALRTELDGAVENKRAWPESVGGYRLGSPLGEGGMGAVFESQSPSGEPCAVKLLRDHATLDRFEREANVALDHPAIARVLAFGVDNGQAFMASELVVGHSLKEVRQVPPARVVAWGLQLCSALAYAHARGVVHRDIKPSNVMLGPDDRVKLIDFGLATGSSEQARTKSGVFLGSHNYAAPEQLNTDRASVGPWTDVYGLGSTLYELLAGRRAFDAPTLWARMQSADKKPPPLEGVPKPLAAAIMRAMAPKPKKRFQNAAEFAALLSAVD